MTAFRPPDGINFHPRECISARELSDALSRIAGFLQSRDPHTPLNRFADWWQHDGLHFAEGTIGFNQLFEFVRTPKALLEAMPGDHAVRIGITPQDASWYLRFILDGNDAETALEGDFDITVPSQLVQEFRAEVVKALPFAMEEQDAADYYSQIRL